MADIEILSPNSLSLNEHVEKILEAEKTVQTSIIDYALTISDAVDQLGEGTQDELCNRIGMSKGTLSKWSSIGSHSILMSIKNQLPASFGALYTLTLLDRDYQSFYGEQKGQERFLSLFSKGKIKSSSVREDIFEIRNLHKETIRKSKSKRNQDLVLSLSGKSEPLGSKTNTLNDLINSNIFFDTFVVIPANEQLKQWRKLELSRYVHEDYPITEIRNTSHVNSDQCLMLIQAKDLDVGLRCLDGWGFSYRDVYTPRQESNGFIGLGTENVIIRGERGSSAKSLNQIDSDKLEDILIFAESIGQKKYILIGKNTDRKDWTVCIG